MSQNTAKHRQESPLSVWQALGLFAVVIGIVCLVQISSNTAPHQATLQDEIGWTGADQLLLSSPAGPHLNSDHSRVVWDQKLTADTVDYLFAHRASSPRSVFIIPASQQVFIMAQHGDERQYQPVDLSQQSLPERCTIEQHGLLTEVAANSTHEQMLMYYTPPLGASEISTCKLGTTIFMPLSH